MDIAQINSLRIEVLLAAFGVAVAFGAIVQRTQFCTMGAISDIVNMGAWSRMRMWGLAVGVAMIGFYALGWFGWLDTSNTIYASGKVLWLSALIGGGLFGFGMVLASGCGSKTLVRIGGGSLKALVVFFVMGFSAYATLSGVLAVVRVNSLERVFFELGSGGTLPMWLAAWLGMELRTAGLLAALVAGGALMVWALANRTFRSAEHLLGGLGLGLTVVAMWWVSGNLGFVAEHPETLEAVFLGTDSGRPESLSFTAPIAYTLDWVILFSDASNVLTLGVASVVGVVVGAWLESMRAGSFRWEGFRDTQDTALHLVGALCMGAGGVTALGCTVGQGLSGLSTLSLGSFLAVTGIVLGAMLGFRMQIWLIERE
ncbi:MAG: YeeE/YedE family protein [Hydrogenophaga sp.]